MQKSWGGIETECCHFLENDAFHPYDAAYPCQSGSDTPWITYSSMVFGHNMCLMNRWWIFQSGTNLLCNIYTRFRCGGVPCGNDPATLQIWWVTHWLQTGSLWGVWELMEYWFPKKNVNYYHLAGDCKMMETKNEIAYSDCFSEKTGLICDCV